MGNETTWATLDKYDKYQVLGSMSIAWYSRVRRREWTINEKVVPSFSSAVPLFTAGDITVT